MRTTRIHSDRAVAWLCAALVSSAAFGQLTWKPQAGGYSGDWDATTPNWTATGADQVTYSGTQAIFAGVDGDHAVTLKKSFSDQTALLFSNGVYTLTASPAVTNKNASNALTFTALSGKTVSLGSGLVFQSTKGSSPHYTFLGGGTVRLESGATLNSDHVNGIIQVGKSASITAADADKGFLVVDGGTILARRRLAISVGAVTIASGTVLIAQASTTESAFPIGLTADYDCGYADLNLTGGLLKITT
jgi:hypothetical protein